MGRHRHGITQYASQPGDDASSDSEITQQSGNDGEYPTAAAALEAGFVKGYAMVDALLQ
jgi:hypothetical protein